MGKKLLVADDSVTIQKVIKLALSSEGYDILAVADGNEAIRAIQQERPDIVLIDVALPAKDAYAVKRAIGADATLAHVGFVLLASAFEKVDEKLAEEVVFQGRLIKPFDPSNLRRVVSDILAKAKNIPRAPSLPPTPETPSVSLSTSDLPPIQDMHPTLGTGEINLDPEKVEETSEEIDGGVDNESDIRDLTESTIKLSGLDDFQWNLDDSRKMKGPSSEPPPAPPRSPNLDVETLAVSRPPSFRDDAGEDRTIELVRPKNESTVPPSVIDDGGSTFPIGTPSFGGASVKDFAAKPSTLVGLGETDAPGSTFDIKSGVSATSSSNPSSPPNPAAAPMIITRMEIEQMVAKDVQAALERLAREVVPQLAEKIIRQEIEKILSEP